MSVPTATAHIPEAIAAAVPLLYALVKTIFDDDTRPGDLTDGVEEQPIRLREGVLAATAQIAAERAPGLHRARREGRALNGSPASGEAGTTASLAVRIL